MTGSSAGIITDWRCPYCGELNGDAIYRCKSCHQVRLPDVERVQMLTARASSPAEARDIERIRSATPLRAAWLYFTWYRMARPYAWVAGSLFGAALVILAVAAPEPTSAQQTGLVMSGVLLGIVLGVGFAWWAGRYRPDGRFRLAVGLLSLVVCIAGYAAVATIPAVLPRPDGQPIMAALVHAIDRAADADTVAGGLVVLLFAAAFVVALLGRAAYGRQGAPKAGP